MKFYCDACNTKYSIPEEKIQGKVLKVRCKNCGHIITVREQAPVEALKSVARPVPIKGKPSPPTPPKMVQVPQSNWHFSVNGQAEGPFTLRELKQRFEAGQLGNEAYVWHETLVEWKPVADVPVFRGSLEQSQQVSPRPKTLGFTGPLEAIKGPEVAEKAVRQDRLDILREKLRQDPAKLDETPEQPRVHAVPKVSERLKTTPEPDSADTSADDLAGLIAASKSLKPELRKSGIQPGPKVDPVIPKVVESKTPEVELKPEISSDVSADELAALIDASRPVESEVSDAGAGFAPVVEPGEVMESQDYDDSAMFDEWVQEESSDESGLLPIFDDIPQLKTTAAPAPTSGSLLIQLDSIKKESRQKNVKNGVVIVGAVCVLMLGIGVFLGTRPPADPQPKAPSAARTYEAPVERVYSREKLTSLGIELDEEVLPAPDSVQAQEEVKARPEKVKRPVRPVEKAESPVAKGQPAQPETPGEVTAQSVLGYTNPAAVQRNPVAVINRPDDPMAAAPTVLSKDAAREGFRIIRQSVMQCRERHMRRGATLDAGKIMIRVTVEPVGKVSKYGVEPQTVANTEFDLCMKSHMDRWRFASWDGVATEISSSFVVQ